MLSQILLLLTLSSQVHTTDAWPGPFINFAQGDPSKLAASSSVKPVDVTKLAAVDDVGFLQEMLLFKLPEQASLHFYLGNLRKPLESFIKPMSLATEGACVLNSFVLVSVLWKWLAMKQMQLTLASGTAADGTEAAAKERQLRTQTFNTNLLELILVEINWRRGFFGTYRSNRLDFFRAIITSEIAKTMLRITEFTRVAIVTRFPYPPDSGTPVAPAYKSTLDYLTFTEAFAKVTILKQTMAAFLCSFEWNLSLPKLFQALWLKARFLVASNRNLVFNDHKKELSATTSALSSLEGSRHNASRASSQLSVRRASQVSPLVQPRSKFERQILSGERPMIFLQTTTEIGPPPPFAHYGSNPLTGARLLAVDTDELGYFDSRLPGTGGELPPTLSTDAAVAKESVEKSYRSMVSAECTFVEKGFYPANVVEHIKYNVFGLYGYQFDTVLVNLVHKVAEARVLALGPTSVLSWKQPLASARDDYLLMTAVGQFRYWMLHLRVQIASYRKAAVDIKISTLRAKEAGDKPTDQSSVLANLNAGKAALTSRYVWILGFSCLINFKRLHIHYKKLASSFVDYMGSKGSEDPLGVMANLDFGMADHDAGPMIGP